MRLFQLVSQGKVTIGMASEEKNYFKEKTKMKNKPYKTIVSCLLSLFMIISISACGGNTGSKEQPSEKPTNSIAATTPQAADTGSAKQAADPDAELAKLATQVLTLGPNGEEPIDATKLQVTDEDIQKLKKMKIRAAISLHYGGNDWSNAQVDGIRNQFAKLGVELIAITDANFKPDKQTSDIETILAKKPDILLVVPSDPVALAPVYKKVAQQGVKIICIGQPAKGLKPGTDYVTVVGTDDYGNGVITAHQMAREIGLKGKIGIIFHEADFPVTKNRYLGFKKTMKDMYPDITIAGEQGIAGPDFTGDAEKAASAFLLRDPDIKAIWGVWDIPAEGIMVAARNAGRDKNLVITTMDLGKNVAIEMAQGGMMKGVGATLVYDMGVAEANAGALAMLGKPVPPFVETKGLSVDKKNVLEGWKIVYHTEPPKELVDAAK
jgi:ribose transport system substrate-binding protein